MRLLLIFIVLITVHQLKNTCSRYARVLARIEKLRPHIRDKARAVLGWVGCAPTPLTIQEIQHVLSIRPGDLEPSKPVSAKPNLNHLCGPIVEIVDDRVEFVHFTVKEHESPGCNSGTLTDEFQIHL